MLYPCPLADRGSWRLLRGRQKRTTWQDFLRTHWEVLAAADFFTVEVWTGAGLTRFAVFFIIELSTRRVEIAGMVSEPDSGAISTNILEFPARVLVMQPARGCYRAATLIPDRVLAVYACDGRSRFSRHRLRTHGRPWRPSGRNGGQHSMVTRPRRLTGISRTTPIGWLRRVSGVRRPRVTSGRLEPRPLCRSTSRPASVREMPNGEAPGCVPGRRTQPIAGPW
jgi:hypothetical protein